MADTKPYNMRERKEARFVQFAEGEMVEGVLVRIDRVEVGDSKKATPRFTVRDLDTGELYSFLGTADLVTKLQMSDLGHVVSIRYEGEDRSVTKNNNAMKRFKVLVSEKMYDPTVITDDDIPF